MEQILWMSREISILWLGVMVGVWLFGLRTIDVALEALRQRGAKSTPLEVVLLLWFLTGLLPVAPLILSAANLVHDTEIPRYHWEPFGALEEGRSGP